MTTKKTLPIWFINRLKKVMEHNEYKQDMLTVEKCNAEEKWTPVDLIIREVYNNGGGSSKGFLGLTRSETYRCFDYIKENQKELKEMNYYNEKGFNNWGFLLWKDGILN